MALSYNKTNKHIKLRLPSKHISYDLCVGLVLVNEVALYVDVSNPHRFVHMIEGCMDCVLINADFVQGYCHP